MFKKLKLLFVKRIIASGRVPEISHKYCLLNFKKQVRMNKQIKIQNIQYNYKLDKSPVVEFFINNDQGIVQLLFQSQF